MATYIDMPKLSDTMLEGTLVKWRVKTGDSIEIGDIIAEVETDKATMEMEAFDDGVLAEIYIQEGQTVAVGQRMALLLAEGEEKPAPGSEPAPSGTPAAPAAADPSQPALKAAHAHHGAPTSGGHRVKASPLARKIAEKKGIDLATLEGSGPGGRIVARDLENPGTTPKRPTAPTLTPLPSAPSAPAPAPIAAHPGGERTPLTGMRRVIAERLLASKTQIPHFYLSLEVDAAPLNRFRKEANASAEANGEPKITVNDFVLKGVAVAATRVPDVNASFAGDSIARYPDVHLAVAVAVDDGLVTPVVRAAQKLSLRQIADAVRDLAGRARAKKLKPEEFQGGTITVSNLGAFGIESFYAIINPPQAVILAVGAITRKPVVDAKGQIVAGERMNISLSADHRVVDGAVGAKFLAELKRLLENPPLMLL